MKTSIYRISKVYIDLIYEIIIELWRQ